MREENAALLKLRCFVIDFAVTNCQAAATVAETLYLLMVVLCARIPSTCAGEQKWGCLPRSRRDCGRGPVPQSGVRGEVPQGRGLSALAQIRHLTAAV